jgi:hypothetical protein
MIHKISRNNSDHCPLIIKGLGSKLKRKPVKKKERNHFMLAIIGSLGRISDFKCGGVRFKSRLSKRITGFV